MVATTPRVLNVSISGYNYPSVLKKIETLIRHKQHGYVCVAAVHLVMECQKDRFLLAGVNRSAATTCDGMPLAWLARLQGFPAERVYGPDLTLQVCTLAAQNQWRIFLLGGGRGQSAQLKRVLEKRFPGIRIVGHEDTPVRPIPQKENRAIIETIHASKAQLVFVGMGCPYQEWWMIQNHQKLHARVLIGVGAAFDFITGRVKQAPPWMRRHGLEWLFRLFQDPRRLWYRYTILNLRFLLLVATAVFWKKR